MRELSADERDWMASYIAQGLAELDRDVTPQVFGRTLRVLESSTRVFRTTGGAGGTETVPPPPSLEDAIRVARGLELRKESATRANASGVPSAPPLVDAIRIQRARRDADKRKHWKR